MWDVGKLWMLWGKSLDTYTNSFGLRAGDNGCVRWVGRYIVARTHDEFLVDMVNLWQWAEIDVGGKDRKDNIT